jgi:hypothetical protein
MPPLVSLRPYQSEVFRNPLGILFFIWRRQCGKSFALANIGLDWMLETPGITVVFMSAALRLGMENIRKEAEVWRSVTSAMRSQMNEHGQYQLTTNADDDSGHLLDVDAVADLMEHQKLECRLFHDNATYSRSIVIAPNPDTAVGFTGHLILDEVGRMPNFREVWEAAQPFVESNPNFLIRGATTPPPDDSHFSYELLADKGQAFFPNPVGTFYRSLSNLPVHRLDAHDAYAANIPLYDLETRQPITPEQSRERSLDKTGWDRNYGCKFIRGGAAAISRQDLQAAGLAGANKGLALNITDQLAAA